MTNPVQPFRRQSQAHKRKGTGTLGYNGAYTAELYARAGVGVGTDGVVIAAVAGSCIRVLSYAVNGSAAGVASITFNSKPAGAGAAISQLISLGTNGGFGESDNNGLFQTVVDEGLSATVGTNTTGVRVTYILVD